MRYQGATGHPRRTGICRAHGTQGTGSGLIIAGFVLSVYRFWSTGDPAGSIERS
ncbi:MAG: hypothetical protein ACHQ4F_09740 [Candidatus Dormibacteria bacterium]